MVRLVILAIVTAAAATSPPFDPHSEPLFDPLAPPTERHGHAFVVHHNPSTTTAAPKTTAHDGPEVSALKQRIAQLESMVAVHSRGPPRGPPGGPPRSFAELFHIGFPPPPTGHVSPYGWHNGHPHGEVWRKIAHRHGGKMPLEHHGGHHGPRDNGVVVEEITLDGPFGAEVERSRRPAWHHAWHHACHHRHHPIFALLLILLVGCTVRRCCCGRRRPAAPQTMAEMESQMQQDERMALELQQMESQQMGVTTYAPAAPAAPSQVFAPSPGDYITPGVAVPMADDDFKGVPQGVVVGTPLATY